MASNSARINMVSNQIRVNQVQDPAVLRALGEIPRESFVSKAKRGVAYVDADLDVGGRWLMEPMVLARMLQEARIQPTDVILNIGDATGYVTAVLARMAGFVVHLDSDPEWVTKAQAALAEVGIDNFETVVGPLGEGHPGKAPYDVIVLSGAMAEIPLVLCRQLVDQGRLVGVERPGRALGEAVLIVRAGDTFGRRFLFEAGTPLLPGTAKPEGFVF